MPSASGRGIPSSSVSVWARSVSDRDAPRRHERDGVDRRAVHVDLVMQVAPERVARVADVGDELSGAHPLAASHLDAAVDDVAVTGLDAATVIDLDVVAVAAVVAG